MKTSSLLLVLFFVLPLATCKKEFTSHSTGNTSSGQTLAKTACSVIDPSNFGSQITNPYFPFIPGTVFRYVNQIIEGKDTSYEHIEVSALSDTKEIAGVRCRIVHDVVTENGKVTEDTYDWYAQDNEGNVWYFGEHSKSLKDKNGWTTEGSWKTGERGACPGIVMWANPEAHIGEIYYQEFLPGIAEDQAQVINTTSTVTVPYGTYTNCLKTKEFSSLEPDVIEYKYYAAGVGQIKTEMTKGGNEMEVLISITH